MCPRLIVLCALFLAVRAVDFREIFQNNPDLQKCWPTFSMFDASGKFPSGIVSGNFIDLGNFDQCISIEEENNATTVKGQYCLVKFHLPPKLKDFSSVFNFFGYNFINSRYNEINLDNVEGRMMLRRMNITDNSTGLIFGWCIPQICPINELTMNLNNAIGDIYKDLKIVPLLDGICQTGDSLADTYNTSNIIFISFLGLTLFIIIISTVYDVYIHYTQKKPAHLILIAFSVKTNGQKLLGVSNNPDQLGCLHGIRFLSMMWVVLCHRFSIAGMDLSNNVLDFSKWLVDASNMYLLNGPVSVDSFFVLNGLLVGYVYCLLKEKGMKFNIILYYIHRYLRLTPVFAIVIWFHATIFDFFGSGPFRPLANTFKTACIDNWWSSLLYIQNYYYKDEMCVSQSWYLAVEMQLFILSPLILIPLGKWPKRTMIACGVLVLGSMASSFAVTYIKDLGGFLTDAKNYQESMDSYYMSTHTRYGPWLMGLMLGYYLFSLKRNKQKKVRLHPVEVAFGWIISMVLMVSALFGAHDLILNRDRLGNSFFNGFHRHGWSLGLCWVIYACIQGYGGPVNSFLSWSFFQITARFTYTIYLVHYSLQYVIIASVRTTTNFSNFQTMYDFWGDFMFSCAIAVCLTLAFESPMITIEKILFRAGQKSKKPESPGQNTAVQTNGQTNKGFIA